MHYSIMLFTSKTLIRIPIRRLSSSEFRKQCVHKTICLLRWSRRIKLYFLFPVSVILSLCSFTFSYQVQLIIVHCVIVVVRSKIPSSSKLLWLKLKQVLSNNIFDFLSQVKVIIAQISIPLHSGPKLTSIV